MEKDCTPLEKAPVQIVPPLAPNRDTIGTTLIGRTNGEVMAAKSIQQVMDARLLAIFRGDYGGRWRDWAEALIAGGVTILEVTLNSPGVLNAITHLRADLGDRALVGLSTAPHLRA